MSIKKSYPCQLTILQAAIIYRVHIYLEAMSTANGCFDSEDKRSSEQHSARRSVHGQRKRRPRTRQASDFGATKRTDNDSKLPTTHMAEVEDVPRTSSKPTNAQPTIITTTSRRDHASLRKQLEPLSRAVRLERDKNTSFEHACAKGMSKKSRKDRNMERGDSSGPDRSVVELKREHLIWPCHDKRKPEHIT
jgi:hypothetical protein